MSKLAVYIKGIYAGELEKKSSKNYVFTYDEAYRTDNGCPAVSLNMPKSQSIYESEQLINTIVSIERGSKSPSIDTVTKVADVLGLDLRLELKA